MGVKAHNLNPFGATVRFPEIFLCILLFALDLLPISIFWGCRVKVMVCFGERCAGGGI